MMDSVNTWMILKSVGFSSWRKCGRPFVKKDAGMLLIKSHVHCLKRNKISDIDGQIIVF